MKDQELQQSGPATVVLPAEDEAREPAARLLSGWLRPADNKDRAPRKRVRFFEHWPTQADSHDKV